MNHMDQTETIIAMLTGSTLGIFLLALLILNILMPFIIFGIYRASRRTAAAAEYTNRQMEALLDALNRDQPWQ